MSALLLLAALAAAPASDAPSHAARAAEPPPIRILLDNDRRFRAGDRARVQVEPFDDGYLWVLQVETDGRLRVLFPLDPDDDNYVRGGRRYEIRGRGGRESFVAYAPSGEGFLYAALSRQPFDFQALQRNGHWDYRTLAPRALAEDPEPELNDLVQRAALTTWDYDLLAYQVGERRDRVEVVAAPVLVNGYVGAPIGWGGRYWWRDPFCNDWWYGSVGCNPYAGFGGSILGVQVGGVAIGVGSGWGGWGWNDPWAWGWNDPWAWGWNDPWAWNRGWGWNAGWHRGWAWDNGWYGGWGWNRGWGNGWGGGWHRDPWWDRGPYGHGGGWNRGPGIQGTNYDSKGRGRTWAGAPATAPVTFAEVNRTRERQRTGRTVAGPAPTWPVRDVDPTEGLGGLDRPVIPAGFPGRGRSWGGRTATGGAQPAPAAPDGRLPAGGGDPAAGRDRRGGVAPEQPGSTTGRGFPASPEGRGRARSWDGAPPARGGDPVVGEGPRSGGRPVRPGRRADTDLGGGMPDRRLPPTVEPSRDGGDEPAAPDEPAPRRRTWEPRTVPLPGAGPRGGRAEPTDADDGAWMEPRRRSPDEARRVPRRWESDADRPIDGRPEPRGDDAGRGYRPEPRGDDAGRGYRPEPRRDDAERGYRPEPRGDDAGRGYRPAPQADDGGRGYRPEPRRERPAPPREQYRPEPRSEPRREAPPRVEAPPRSESPKAQARGRRPE